MERPPTSSELFVSLNKLKATFSVARVEFGLAALLFGYAHPTCTLGGIAALWSPRGAAECGVIYRGRDATSLVWAYDTDSKLHMINTYMTRRFLDIPPITERLVLSPGIHTPENLYINRTHLGKDGLWALLQYIDIMAPDICPYSSDTPPFIYNFPLKTILALHPSVADMLTRGPTNCNFTDEMDIDCCASYLAGVLSSPGWYGQFKDYIRSRRHMRYTLNPSELVSVPNFHIFLRRTIELLGPAKEDLLIYHVGDDLAENAKLLQNVMECALWDSRGNMLLALAKLWSAGKIAKPSDPTFDERDIKGLLHRSMIMGANPDFYEGLRLYASAALGRLDTGGSDEPWIVNLARRHFVGPAAPAMSIQKRRMNDKICPFCKGAEISLGEEEIYTCLPRRAPSPSSAARALESLLLGCGSPIMTVSDFEYLPEHAALLLNKPKGVAVRLTRERLETLLSCPRGPSSCIVRATAMVVADGMTVRGCISVIREWSEVPLGDGAFSVYMDILSELGI